jgi:hypothetical protein
MLHAPRTLTALVILVPLLQITEERLNTELRISEEGDDDASQMLASSDAPPSPPPAVPETQDLPLPPTSEPTSTEV